VLFVVIVLGLLTAVTIGAAWLVDRSDKRANRSPKAPSSVWRRTLRRESRDLRARRRLQGPYEQGPQTERDRRNKPR
jgi:hypothetical protein